MNWFLLTIDILTSVVTGFIVLQFLNKVFLNRFTDNKSNTIISLLLMVGAIITTADHFFELVVSLRLFSTSLIACFYSVYCLKGSIFRKLILSLIGVATSVIITSLIEMFLTFSLGKSSVNYLESETLRIVRVFLSIITFYFFMKILAIVIKKERLELKTSEYSVAIVFFIVTHFILFALFSIELHSNLTDELMLISTIGLLIANIAVFLMVRNLSKQNKNNLKISLLELQLAEQKSVFQEAAYISKEIKKSEHDLKHHLSAVLDNIRNKNYENAEQYMQTLLKEYETNIFKYVFIDNSIINSVLNLKIAKCHENKIDIKLVANANFDAFDDTDICVIISNLMDNAIEASLKENNPQITFSIKNEKSYLCILIRNKISKSVLENNNDLTTTKPDKVHHGLGLYSITQICEKYDGIKNTYENNGYFVTDVWLKKPIC